VVNVNVVFIGRIWRTENLMWTGTESFNWDRIGLYICGEQRVCLWCVVFLCLVVQCREQKV
jgi:hypothetical protein